MNDVATVISVIPVMIEATDQAVALAVDRYPGNEIVIETETELDHGPYPVTETPTAVATEAETVIVTVMTTAHVADPLHADVHVHDLDLVLVPPENSALVHDLPPRDEGHDLAVPHALDGLPPLDGPLRPEKHPLLLISTVMCRRLATEANHPVVGPAPQIANKDHDLAKLIVTSLAPSERAARKERSKIQQSRLKTRMTEVLVGGVVVDEGARADVEVVHVDEVVLAGEAEDSYEGIPDKPQDLLLMY
ncbi:uncharacterized protein N7484_002062 [Penicillium longicatenatum]|uniref:uncharacterized protein n=1 Tax=Penicillium longicatenatum TaxID=1561947 RepID=UPI0025467607|nr:uncharacterized protein N7484_002062 [Penicillium longicatenatum]KAJ5658413.1 hypothetical protein N7484_002062 [Penicillium longicatenatum]